MYKIVEEDVVRKCSAFSMRRFGSMVNKIGGTSMSIHIGHKDLPLSKGVKIS
jgi:hypothetical protein